MSEPEKKSGGSATPLVVMEHTTASRHKTPIRPTELQEEATNLHHKHSKAPVVETVAEELKDISKQDVKESDDDTSSSEQQKQSMAKALSSTIKKRETITLNPIEMESKIDNVSSSPPQPIPPSVESVSDASHLAVLKTDTTDKKGENDSITEEIAELRTPEATKKHSDWSDDEEASGLPRSESRASRASRVSRAVRQLLCCGVRYEAASEDEISPRPGYATGI